MGWRLTRHWGDGTPDSRMEVWFDGAVNLLTEASDGTLLVAGAFTLADGIPSRGLAQLIPPAARPGIRWHAGTTGFSLGERAAQARIPVWREAGLETEREISVTLPASPALADDAPTTAVLRFEAGARMGWVTVPLRNRTEAGPDTTLELTLPEAELTPGAAAGVRFTVYRDEQTFGFSQPTVVLDEPVMPPFSPTEALGNPRVVVRRLSGLAFAGSTLARFAGGTVRSRIDLFPDFLPYQGDFDFHAGIGDIPAPFLPWETIFALPVGPYDDALLQGDRTALFTLDGPGPQAGQKMTVVVRDNDVWQPANVRGRFESYQSLPGVPFLFRSTGILDGRAYTQSRITAPDGRTQSGEIFQRSGDSMIYYGQGPGGTHYFFEYAFINSLAPVPRLVRHLADGRPDLSFSPVRFIPGPRNGGRTVPVATAPNGFIVVLTGDEGINVSGPFSVARIIRRFGNDGVPHPRYAAQVYVPAMSGGGQGQEAILLPHSDGSLLVVARGAFSTNALQRDVIRFTPAGAQDHAFRSVISFEASLLAKIDQAVLDPSGRCLLAGRFIRVDGVPRPGFARLTTAGRVDMTFAPDFLAGYPGRTLTSVGNFPGGRSLVVLGSPARSTLLVLNDSGSPDPMLPPVEFDGWVGSAKSLPGSTVVATGEIHTVQGQTRHNEVWFDSSFHLLGEVPLALRLRSVGLTTTELTVDARAAGTVGTERGSLDGFWEPIGEVNAQIGSNSVVILTPSGERGFLRANRR